MLSFNLGNSCKFFNNILLPALKIFVFRQRIEMPTPYVREVYVHSPGTSAPAHRSIPTHVGFTLRCPFVSALLAVHPHARGVYVYTYFLRSRVAGPSPRTWGLRPPESLRAASLRSIPTHVGFTLVPRPAPRPTTVHPHAHGVYCMMSALSSHPLGPSPRTWGLRIPE